jgi:hypothetical protein
MASRSLAEIEFDIARAKARLGQLRAEEYRLLRQYPCTGCGAPVGASCVKVSGFKTAAHAERHRAARDGS